MSLSHAIFGFIRNLPQFQPKAYTSGDFAIRVTDGTLISVPDDLQDCESGLLLVRWQGDSRRKALLNGNRLTAFLIVEGAKHLVALGHHNNVRQQVSEWVEHYAVKTGETISIDDYGVQTHALSSSLKYVISLFISAIAGAVAGKVL